MKFLKVAGVAIPLNVLICYWVYPLLDSSGEAMILSSYIVIGIFSLLVSITLTNKIKGTLGNIIPIVMMMILVIFVFNMVNEAGEDVPRLKFNERTGVHKWG